MCPVRGLSPVTCYHDLGRVVIDLSHTLTLKIDAVPRRGNDVVKHAEMSMQEIAELQD